MHAHLLNFFFIIYLTLKAIILGHLLGYFRKAYGVYHIPWLIYQVSGEVLNSGGRYGGAITAAMFLEEFVGEGIKWVHLDIAGPAHLREEFSYYAKGGTGFGVRTCVEYILRLGGKG